jgi:anti-sigma B factor antagonist
MNLNHHIETTGITVLELRVIKLNASNSHAFLQAMKPHLREQRRVVLDIAGVQFIDSMGLGALLGCLRKIKVLNGQLHLCELSPTVGQLFKLMRLHNTITIYGTCADAVQGFAVLQS